MTVELTITVDGADRLQKGLSNAPDVIEQETHTAMTTAMVLLEATQRRTVAMDTRRLMGSIHHTIKGRGANITGTVGPSVRYAYWVEHGRKPGRRPPVAAISGWARRHGVNPYVLAKAIGKHGTKARPFVAPSWKKNASKVRQIFDAIGVKVVAAVTK